MGRAGGQHLVPSLVGGGGSLLGHLEALPLEDGAGQGGPARGTAACNSDLVIFLQTYSDMSAVFDYVQNENGVYTV